MPRRSGIAVYARARADVMASWLLLQHVHCTYDRVVRTWQHSAVRDPGPFSVILNDSLGNRRPTRTGAYSAHLDSPTSTMH
ncbi:hypothetical protein DENSPDRAFT_833591 [Dentipellis sp. KUC8613]|nr:hypothetical protein DENSPDRAFT_833591 [Dentipellis sp. KUC8613]